MPSKIQFIKQMAVQKKAGYNYTMGNTVWSSGEYEFSEPKRVLVRSRDDR